jgi:flagellar hook-associated protein 3 FlgL
MVNTFIRNLNRNSGKMEKLQSQLATNRRIVRLSDDPVGVIKTLNAKAKQSDITQYLSNLRDAEAWLAQTESALNEAYTIVARCYELTVHAANDVLSSDDRAAIAGEVRQLRDQLITLGNTTLGDKYLFGGYNVSYPPFFGIAEDGEEAEITLNGFDMLDDPVQEQIDFIQYEINVGVDFEVGFPGGSFMGMGEYEYLKPDGTSVTMNRNMYYQFHEFVNTLINPEMFNPDFLPFVDGMQKLQQSLIAQMSECGGRRARIELMESRYAQDYINYTQMRSDVEDLDQAEGIMNFTMAESVYRAALNVGGRILPPTLMDFLR